MKLIVYNILIKQKTRNTKHLTQNNKHEIEKSDGEIEGKEMEFKIPFLSGSVKGGVPKGGVVLRVKKLIMIKEQRIRFPLAWE